MKIVGPLSICLLIMVFRTTAQGGDSGAVVSNLLPVPSSVKFQPGRLPLTKTFRVAITGYSDSRLQSYLDRAIKRLEGRLGIELPLLESGSSEAERPDGSSASVSLLVECGGPGRAVPSLDEDESYSLDVSSTQAVLKAPAVVGAMRGIETFLQLVTHDQAGNYIPAVTIQDKPRFRWRGLLIDVGRHFEPVEVLKRNLDGMAAVKLNVFHWHLTEDQGFRVESHRFPELAKMGSDGLYYTQEEIRDVIAYARDRGIRVVPEFDMPGHVTSWLVSHPELASAPGPYQIERQGGVFDPAFNPANKSTYGFLNKFLGEMASLFPDAYMHIGGDENNGKQWNRNPRIQAFMKKNGLKDNRALQAYFNQQIFKILKKHGKRMVGWDEILNPDLPKDIVIQSWRGPASLAEAAKQGYDGILSAGYYIDLMYPASQHYAVDPLSGVTGGGDLTADQAAHILGGEATMWGEYVGPETIDSRIWPRTAAIAERLWSPASVKDTGDMYRRLEVIGVQLEEFGLCHIKNPDMMLRRLAGSPKVGDLRVLIDLVEPAKQYQRGSLHPTTMLSPLTGIVDIARPESEEARLFSRLVDGLLGDAPRFRLNKDHIEDKLRLWKSVQSPISTIAERTPALQDAGPLSDSLARAAEIAESALSYLGSGGAPPDDWMPKALAGLKDAAEPRAAVDLAIIPAIRQLVLAAGRQTKGKN
ncbi:MAG TPA: family 20 glycosylhydrolase [Blastocatellia bacterium]|nr:family 20 glycosylhydrolase [Blastocatellia bacterium]